MNHSFFSLILFLSVFCFSCQEDQRALDESVIQNYIQQNNLNAIAAQDGLYYVIDSIGSGAQASSVNSTVSVHYTGRFFDGGIFESSLGASPIVGQLFNFIKGWQYGIPYFNAGGSGRLLIPSHLAYGSQGAGSIPPNTPIIFEIDLIAVQN